MRGLMTALAACGFIALLATIATAQKHKVDFDQGVDASALLQEARAKAAAQLPAIPRVSRRLHGLKRSGTKALPYPAVGPLVSNNAAYQSAASLHGDSRYQALDPQALQPLEQAWGRIGSLRADLSSCASVWDRQDQQLGVDGAQLDQARTALLQRQSALNTEVGQFNQQCTGRPLPPDQYQQCVSWQQDLQQRINQFEADRQQFNGQVDSWNQRSQSILADRNTLIGQLQAWEGEINNWIDAVKKAIESECRPLDKVNIPGTSPIALTSTDPPVTFEAQTLFKSEPSGAPPCPVDLSWVLSATPDLPNVSMGGLSTVSGKTTDFRPGPGTGKATLTVADRNSGKGSNAVDIIVFNPSARAASPAH